MHYELVYREYGHLVLEYRRDLVDEAGRFTLAERIGFLLRHGCTILRVGVADLPRAR